VEQPGFVIAGEREIAPEPQDAASDSHLEEVLGSTGDEHPPGCIHYVCDHVQGPLGREVADLDRPDVMIDVVRRRLRGNTNRP
jgi:hypothetical protein